MQKAPLQKLGRIEVENAAAEGWRLARGREFTYSTMDPMPETVTRIYYEPAEGHRIGSVTGSYVVCTFSPVRALPNNLSRTAPSGAHKIQDEQTPNTSYIDGARERGVKPVEVPAE